MRIKSKKSFLTLLITICLILTTTTTFVTTNISADTIFSHHLYEHPPWDWHGHWADGSEGAEFEAHSSDVSGDCETECKISGTGSEDAYAGFKHQKDYTHTAENVDGSIKITYEVSWDYNMGFNFATGTAYTKIWFVFFVNNERYEYIRFEGSIPGGTKSDSRDNEQVSHTFNINFVKGNTYEIGVEVRIETSVEGIGIEIWSRASADHSYEHGDPNEIILSWVNRRPAKPDRPSGETSGKAGVEYEYTTSTTDDDKDALYYYWNWGDGTAEDEEGPYQSGESGYGWHEWAKKGTYDIKVRAEDKFNGLSDWSLPLAVTMPVLHNEGCLAGTQITMTSGFPKSIEDIEVGEFIVSYDPISQMTTAAEVIEIYEFTEDLPDYNLIFNGDLEVTSRHTLYINGIGWMEADDAQIGYYILGNIPDTPDIYPIAIFSKEPTEPAGPIYDLVIQPLAGEAIGYWADGILVGGYVTK